MGIGWTCELHFEDLTPRQFQDLARAILWKIRTWDGPLEDLGSSGDDDGYDARGWDIDRASGQRRLWKIQAKRYKDFGPSRARRVVTDLVAASEDHIHGLVIVTSADVSRKARFAVHEVCNQHHVTETIVIGRGELKDMMARPGNESLMDLFFGRPERIAASRNINTSQSRPRLEIQNEITKSGTPRRLRMSEAAARWLYAVNGNHCAFPGCAEFVVLPPPDDAGVVITSNIAHIVAASLDASRGQSQLTDEERSQPDDLILLCDKHYDVVNALRDQYSVEMLREMKRKHESKISSLRLPRSRRLPKDTPLLLGRDDDLDRGLRWLCGDNGHQSQTTGHVLLITGPPGIGKTAFAVRLAHRAADRFPDGQVFLTADADAAGDLDAVDELLRALGADDPGSSWKPQERTALLQSVLADRRILIVMDDVKSESTLGRVLTLDGNHSIICTSRSRLSGLYDSGALFIELKSLSTSEGARLAGSIAGTSRLTDMEAVELAAVCGGHPLATRIAASRLATRPSVRFADYLEEVADPDRGLHALSIGERSVEKVIDVSYRSLTMEQARLFNTLGLLPNTTIPLEVIAAANAECLKGPAREIAMQARDQLDVLFELSLVEQPDTDVYRLHHILYQFARAKAGSGTQVNQFRVLEHGCLMYAALVHAATHRVGFTDATARTAAPGTADALGQLDRYRAGCLAILEAAARKELWEPLITLSQEITPSLHHRCDWTAIERIYGMVKEAAERTGNDSWLDNAMYHLGAVAAHMGNPDQALDLYRRSAQIAKDCNNLHLTYAVTTAYADLTLGYGDAVQALALLKHSLRAWRLLGDDTALAITLLKIASAYSHIGNWKRAERYLHSSRLVAERSSIAGLYAPLRVAHSALLRQTGRVEEAHVQCLAGLEAAQAVGDRRQEGEALLELGQLRQHRDIAESAFEPLERALEAFRELGDESGELSVLRSLASCMQSDGQLVEAARLYRQCVSAALRRGAAGDAALCLAHEATIWGDLGHAEEARRLFLAAEQAAAAAGSNMILAHVRHTYGLFLLWTGDIKSALSLLKGATTMLSGLGQFDTLASARVGLGDALMNDMQWQAAALAFRSVTEAPPDTIAKSTRSLAYRQLAVLYSRRHLSTEAEHSAERALMLAQECGDIEAQMHAHLILGNVRARVKNLNEALAAYDRALELAVRRNDARTALAIRINQLACREADDEVARMSEMRGLISLARESGLVEIETVLHINLGGVLARRGNVDEGMAEFHQAHDLAVSMRSDRYIARTCAMLSEAYWGKGDAETARSFAKEARTLLESRDEWTEAARALLLEVRDRLDRNSGSGELQMADVISDTKPSVRGEVLIALKALIEGLQDEHAPVNRPAGRRSIDVADTVREALMGLPVESVVDRLADTSQECVICRLPIAQDGSASLVLLGAPTDDGAMVRIAHPSCCVSVVLPVASPSPMAPPITMEIECAFVRCDLPCVIIDCRGPQTVTPSGRLVDVFIEGLRHAGFEDVSRLEIVSDHVAATQRVELPRAVLTADLNGNRLTVRSKGDPVVRDAPLSFLPNWYRATKGGSLVVVCGRSLQGMSWEDPSYLVRAAESGQLVAAVAQLRVMPPTRNSRCICTPPTGLKFKRCCGKTSQR